MRRTHIWFLGLLLAAGIGLWSSVGNGFQRWAREGIFPYQVGWHWLAHAWRYPGRLRTELRSGMAERRRLEQELRDLQYARIHLDELQAENATLRRLLDMRERTPGHPVVARVLSRGGAGDWWATLRIAAGENRGIRPNQPVLGADGLLGRIVDVTPSTSDVLLLTDPNSRIACRLDPPVPGAVGIVFGAGVRRDMPSALKWLYRIEPLQWRFIERDVEIPENARVVTAGQGGVFPAGLPIGWVSGTGVDVQGLYREAQVFPFSDPRTLTHVLVMAEGTGP